MKKLIVIIALLSSCSKEKAVSIDSAPCEVVYIHCEYDNLLNISRNLYGDTMTDQQRYFISSLNAAYAVKYKYNVPIAVTLAQSALESNFGRSKLTKQSNNYFGVKCWSLNCGVNFKDDTKEDQFKVYNNKLGSFLDYGRFLQKKRYARAFKFHNYKSFIKEIHKAGYATDPNYSNKVINLITKYKLYKL